MTVKWFGETWGAPVCEDASHVDTPIGSVCPYCCARILADHDGVLIPGSGERIGMVGLLFAYHIDCFLEDIMPSPEPYEENAE